MSDAVKLACLTCGQMNRLPKDRLEASPRCGSCGDALITGKVFDLDPIGHDKASRGDDLPFLVDYWAPWCGPCRAMAPEFLKAAKALAPWVRLGKLNTQDHPAISTRLKITGIPLLILWQRGRELERYPGLRPSAQIIAAVSQKIDGKI